MYTPPPFQGYRPLTTKAEIASTKSTRGPEIFEVPSEISDDYEDDYVDEDIVLADSPPRTDPRPKVDTRRTVTPRPTEDLSRQIPGYLEHHLQFETDTDVERANDANRELHILDCNQRKIKALVIQLLSYQSGILAAKELGLKKCQSLESNGETSLVYQCEPLTLEFNTIVNKCGPQLRALHNGKNVTILQDGITLGPLFCSQENGQANIGEMVFYYNDGIWKPASASVHIAHQHLLGLYNYTIDSFDNGLMTHDNPRSFAFNLLVQLDGLLESTGKQTLSEAFIDHKEQSNAPDVGGFFSGVFGGIQHFVMTLFYILVLVFLIWLTVKLRCCSRMSKCFVTLAYFSKLLSLF